MTFLSNLVHAFGPCEWTRLAVVVAMLVIIVRLALDQKP